MGSFSIWHLLVAVLVLAVLFSPLWIGLLVMGAQRRVVLVHRASGLRKDGFYGYSPTYLFFGFLVPVFRGEAGLGMLHLVFSLFTSGIFQVIMSFLYNKQFTQRQLVGGWEIADPAALDVRARRRLALGPVIGGSPGGAVGGAVGGAGVVGPGAGVAASPASPVRWS